MKLQYYLRGLGIGIIVTAIIMGISLGGKKESLSDEEIKARAAELGMIENTVLVTAEATPTEEAAASVTPTGEPTITVTPTVKATITPTIKPTSTPTVMPTITSTGTAAPTSTPKEEIPANDTVQGAEGESVTITISSGESSVTVSRKVAEAGLVPDASEFDRYLCGNGYDKRLTIGSHLIPAGSDFETIAKALVSRSN